MTAIASNFTKFTNHEFWSVLITIEETLSVDIGLNYLVGEEGRLDIYAKDSDEWLGQQDFSLAGVEDLSSYFTNLLSEHKEEVA